MDQGFVCLKLIGSTLQVLAGDMLEPGAPFPSTPSSLNTEPRSPGMGPLIPY